MGWFREYKPEDPLRKVSNVDEVNRVHRILNDIKGIGCRIEKPRGANGLGWRIVVDGSSDLDPIPDSSVGSDTGQIPVKPYDFPSRFQPIPSGGIIMWSGSIASIPATWALCDGTNGTPNLKSRFVIGAGDTAYPVDGTGGDTSHAHSLFSPTPPPDVFPSTGAGFLQYAPSTDTVSHIPPYYALAYIMKL